MSKEMEELYGMFDEVKDKEPSDLFENLEDGEYLMSVENCEYTTSKAGKPMVKITWKVIYGENEGRYHWQYLMLVGADEQKTKSNLQRMATNLRKLGLDTRVKCFDDLWEQLPETIGKEAVVTLETTVSRAGNSFTNTSFEVKE